MRVVLVEWDDSFSDGGWRPAQDDLPISHCITVGLLQYDSEDKVTITQSKANSGNYADRISIPKSCIRRIRQLVIKH